MDLDEEIDRLYAGAPDDFVAGRDALARRLREEGDRSSAKAVKALRRPTVAAWGVNLVARDDRDGVRALLEAGDALARAQRRALSGVKDNGLREATVARRGAVSRLADRGVALLDEAGASGAPHRDAMVATFEAASSSAEAADVVRRGRLSRELDAPSGFGDVGGLSLIAPEPEEEPSAGGDEAPGSTTEEDEEATRRAEERRRLEAAVADARETLEARRAAAAEVERSASAARRDAETAGREADDAEAEADRLEREAAAARREAERARRRASRAEEEADEQQSLAARRRRSAIAADEALDEAEEALRAAGRG